MDIGQSVYDISYFKFNSFSSLFYSSPEDVCGVPPCLTEVDFVGAVVLVQRHLGEIFSHNKHNVNQFIQSNLGLIDLS